MSEPTRSEFRTVADFVALPADKIDACLLDFQQWLRAIATFRAMNLSGVRIASPQDVFTWVDDGKHILSMSVSDMAGREVFREDYEFAPPDESLGAQNQEAKPHEAPARTRSPAACHPERAAPEQRATDHPERLPSQERDTTGRRKGRGLIDVHLVLFLPKLDNSA